MKQQLGHLREEDETKLSPDQERDKELFEVPDNLKVIAYTVSTVVHHTRVDFREVRPRR